MKLNNNDHQNGSPRTQSRRQLLELGWKSAAAVFALGGTQLSARTSAGGRVLVQLQLFGGNDSNNMIVPLDGIEYSRYAAARGPLAIPRSALLPIETPRQNATFGLHPALAELHDLYQRKALAIVANSGRMAAPLTKVDVATGGVPRDAQDHLTSELAYVKDGFTTPAWAPPLMGVKDRFDLMDRIFTFSTGVSMISAHAGVSGGGSGPTIPNSSARWRLRRSARRSRTPSSGAK